MTDRRSFSGAVWQPSATVSSGAAATAAGRSEVTARVLAGRVPEAQAADFLAPSLDHLHDPFLMLGMEVAVDRLRRAARDRERVRIITDYDVDGTTSSLILQATLRLLAPDAQVDFHIPHRFEEGYGFSVAAAQAAASERVGLIVTADIGVRDHASVAAAREAGVDVLICDHHLPAGEAVPEAATAVLCPPQASCTYPNPALAACGVSLKLAQALLVAHPRRDVILRSLLKLAAIGTVADMVSLTTLENRAIVKLGLDALNAGGHHPGLAALLEVSGVVPGEISASHLGYQVGPRINAAGRVADARLVVQLLNSRDPDTARSLAREIDALNASRRNIQGRLVEEARARLADREAPFIVVAGPEEEGWHRGVVGIVASRLKDELYRPVAVISIQGDTAVGSMRCPPGRHAVEALNTCADLLQRYGGHPAAAGFTLPARHLDELTRRLTAWAESSASTDASVPHHLYDAELDASVLDEALCEELGRLEPYGMGNPKPVLLVRGVLPERVDALGKEGRMVRVTIGAREGRPLDAMWWDQAQHLSALRGGRLDLLGSLEWNVYRDRKRMQLRLTDARASG